MERVVVAVNGGAGSTAALSWVLNRAETVPLAIELTTVIELQSSSVLLPEEQLGSAYEKVLADAADQVRARAPGVSLMQSVRRGSTTHELLAASVDADLLVIGTREPTGYFSGTLRHQIAAGARCPVIVVPADWTPTDGSVVVGIDDDATSLVAVDFAADEADRTGRMLDLVHAWHLPVVLTAQWLASGADPYIEIRRTQEAFLAETARSTGADHPGLRIRESLEQGPPAAVLTDLAEDADLVVVGTHRHGLIPGLLLGSVSHDLLVRMPCPVAAVPHPDEFPVRVTSR